MHAKCIHVMYCNVNGFTLPERILVSLSLGCFLKGFIVSNFWYVASLVF